jgi:hypothetical protein
MDPHQADAGSGSQQEAAGAAGGGARGEAEPAAQADALRYVMRYLGPRGLGQVACAARQARRLAEDETVWKALCYRDFGILFRADRCGRTLACDRALVAGHVSLSGLSFPLAVARGMRHTGWDGQIKFFTFKGTRITSSISLALVIAPPSSLHLPTPVARKR